MTKSVLLRHNCAVKEYLKYLSLLLFGVILMAGPLWFLVRTLRDIGLSDDFVPMLTIAAGLAWLLILSRVTRLLHDRWRLRR